MNRETVSNAHHELGLAALEALSTLFVGCGEEALELPEYKELNAHLYKVGMTFAPAPPTPGG